MKYIVDRQTWYRGKGSTYSKLLRDDGLRCCIGHVGKQCGYADAELLRKATVSSIDVQIRFPEWMIIFPGSSSDSPRTPIEECYVINDDIIITEEERESRLKALFEANGDEIEFIN